MKILVNTPDINALGGVSNHYLGLKPYWNANVKYNNIGSKRIRKWLTPFSLIKYIYYLIVFRPDVIILNPSLGNGALIRDFFYMKLALAFGKKVAIFMHGFNLDYAENINRKWAVKNFNKASTIQDAYAEWERSLDLSSIPCPSCSTVGCLCRYDHYDRFLICSAEDIDDPARLSFLVVKCASCAHNHAVLIKEICLFFYLFVFLHPGGLICFLSWKASL